MIFDFLSNNNTTTVFLLLIIFVLFVLAFRKVLGILKNALMIVAASVIFPLVANKFLGANIPFNADTVIFFASAGLTLYFFYVFASILYKAISKGEKEVEKKLPKIDIGDGKKKKEEKKEEIKPKNEKPISFKKNKKQKDWEKDYVKITEEPENKKDRK